MLRLHFSLFLLPVFLFALSEAPEIDITRSILTFLILHLLVYPASNGYNSYMDRDETPIGGLAQPMQPTRQLFHVTLIMDLIALALSFFIGLWFALGILLYILASRAYSYRKIRLKRHPVAAFLTVFVFQGGWIFFLTYHAVQTHFPSQTPLLPVLVSSMLIGGLYPLTQIYQYEEDLKDDVVTISYLLGRMGSFVFSALLFITATILLYLHFQQKGQPFHFYLYLILLFPVVLFFLYWMMQVRRNENAANFRNSLRMNLVATFCTSAYFITLIALK